jgi:hypothetical protein
LRLRQWIADIALNSAIWTRCRPIFRDRWPARAHDIEKFQNGVAG